MRCPKCYTENKDTAIFCKSCGSPLKNIMKPYKIRKFVIIAAITISILVIVLVALRQNSLESEPIPIDNSGNNTFISEDKSPVAENKETISDSYKPKHIKDGVLFTDIYFGDSEDDILREYGTEKYDKVWNVDENQEKEGSFYYDIRHEYMGVEGELLFSFDKDNNLVSIEWRCINGDEEEVKQFDKIIQNLKDNYGEGTLDRSWAEGILWKDKDVGAFRIYNSLKIFIYPEGMLEELENEKRAELDGGYIEYSDEGDLEITEYFDKNGVLEKREEKGEKRIIYYYDKDGTINKKKEYLDYGYIDTEYRKDGTISLVTMEHDDKKVDEYDLEGKIAVSTQYNGDGDVRYVEYYNYDENGNWVSTEVHDSRGSVYYKDQDGNVLR